MKRLVFALLVCGMVLSPSRAFADAADAAMLKKISDKQDRLLQMMEELKSELNIVKVRVTN